VPNRSLQGNPRKQFPLDKRDIIPTAKVDAIRASTATFLK
jgi:hypothetical protein